MRIAGIEFSISHGQWRHCARPLNDRAIAVNLVVASEIKKKYGDEEEPTTHK